MLEQGLAFDELVEDQARRRGTRRVRWASIVIPRRCSVEGCCTTPSSELSDGGVPHHRRSSLMVEARLHVDRVTFLGKLGSTAAATEALRREHGRWWASSSVEG